MQQEEQLCFNIENEKYKDFIVGISHENKGFEYDLKKRAIQFLNFLSSDKWSTLFFSCLFLYLRNFLTSLLFFVFAVFEF